ncbi:Jasmonate O-methyltransferase [Acorus calamus]|uniref:Jasmonate O-methyltransferase n=1 Tax=Acorus calamus TaxID=4465 RepID=A0AAV9DL93_ACOCL|nr:Jasmonate O-methyltransferase [Acorus calamus]
MKKAIVDVYCATFPERMDIANLGCSSGPTAMSPILEVVDVVDQKRWELGRPPMEFQCFLNDLPQNDFNTLFKTILPEFYEKPESDKGRDQSPCFIVGVPGSFYGRLFPKRSLHFVISSTRAHVHLNRGEIYMSKTSAPCVFNYYLEQFHRDFSTFLKSRSEEIVMGGRMVLTMIGRKVDDPSDEDLCHGWIIMTDILKEMVSEGLIEEEKIDSFNAPYYTPSPKELVEVIEGDGSFTIDRLEILEMDLEKIMTTNNDDDHGRAIMETMLKSHFGSEIMDDLFHRFEENLKEFLSRKYPVAISILVSLVRKG